VIAFVRISPIGTSLFDVVPKLGGYFLGVLSDVSSSA